MTKLNAENTMTEIVEAYNSLTDLKVKKFTNKTIGLERLAKLQAQVDAESDDFVSQVLTALENAGALTAVKEVNIALPNGLYVPDKKAIIEDTFEESYVSTVGKDYKLIQNRELFTEFANVLKESKLDATGMIVTPTVTKSRCFVKFQFPAHRIEIRENDYVNLMITAKNSYDGSIRFTLDIGGFRLLCSNGMGIGAYTNVYSNKHSKGFSHSNMAKYLETAVEVFTSAGAEWVKMTNRKVNEEDVLEVLKIMTDRKTDLNYNEILEGKNTTLKAALIRFENYRAEMGMNQFALLNAVTHLATHVESKNGGDLVVLMICKNKLRDKAVNSEHFKKYHKAA